MPAFCDTSKCALDFGRFKKGDSKVIIDYYPASSAGATQGRTAICATCAKHGGIQDMKRIIHEKYGDATSTDVYEIRPQRGLTHQHDALEKYGINKDGTHY